MAAWICSVGGPADAVGSRPGAVTRTATSRKDVQDTCRCIMRNMVSRGAARQWDEGPIARRKPRAQRLPVTSVNAEARDGVDLPGAGGQALDPLPLLGDQTLQHGPAQADHLLAGETLGGHLRLGDDDDEYDAMAAIGRIDVGPGDREGVEQRIVFDRRRL